MPIDNIADRATEKDGSNNSECCTYCYQNGALMNLNMTFEELKSLVISQMKQMDLLLLLLKNQVKARLI